MFRGQDSVAQSSQSLLKNSALRKLKVQLQAAFPKLTAEALDELLPKGETVVTKLLQGRVLWYGVAGRPLFFDTTNGKGDLYPTVRATWLQPDAFDVFYTNQHVSVRVIGGADLMLPGVARPPQGIGPLRRGDKRVIKVIGNPRPFAVGEVLVDDAHVESKGMRGRGLRVHHVYGDALWGLGEREHPDGFSLKSGVSPTEDPMLVFEMGNDGDEDEDDEEEEGEEDDEEEDEDEEEVKTPAQDEEDGDEQEEGKEEAAETVITREEMDDALRFAFLYSLKERVPDEALPIGFGEFFSAHMRYSHWLPLNVKQSSHKKLTKFMKEMSKEAFITTKPMRKADTVIASVNRYHPELKAFGVSDAQRKALDKAERKAKQGDGATSSHGAAAGGGKDQTTREPVRIEFKYKPDRQLAESVFVDAPGGPFYELSDARAILWAYVKREELVANRSHVTVDANLRTGIVRRNPTPETIPKGELGKLLLQRLTKYHGIFIPGEPEELVRFRPGEPPPVVVSTERRQGRKTVTKVSGLEHYGIDPTTAAQHVQRRFACAATTQEDIHSKGRQGHTVIAQGDIESLVGAFLTETFGVPSTVIEQEGMKGGSGGRKKKKKTKKKK